MRQALRHRLALPLAALVVLLVVNTVARPDFVKITVRDGRLYGALIDILRQSSPLLLVALGMTLVIATRGIDLSVGAVMAVSGAVTLTVIDSSSSPGAVGTVLLAILAGLGISLLLGLWNGMLVAVVKVQPIVATLVLMLAGRGIALLVTEGFITTVNSEPLAYVASGSLFGLPFAFVLAIAVVLVIGALERRTALGVLTEAVGINPEASRLAGVRSGGIILTAYAITGVLAGLAGVVYSSNIMAADANATGEFIELYAILAVVLGRTSLRGGKFSIVGTVIGVLIIKTLDSTMLFLGVSSAQSPLVFALVVALVVLSQSTRVKDLWGRLAHRRHAPALTVEVAS